MQVRLFAHDSRQDLGIQNRYLTYDGEFTREERFGLSVNIPISDYIRSSEFAAFESQTE